MATLWAYIEAKSGTSWLPQVYRSDDDGATWNFENFFDTWSTGSVWGFINHGDRRFHGLSASNMYIAAQNRGLFHRTSEGGAFNIELDPGVGGIPSNTRFFTVFAVASDDVWVGSGYGAYLLWHWNGATWTNESASILALDPQIYAVYSIWASGPNDVWAVGETNAAIGCFVHHYNGAAWTDRTPPTGSPPGGNEWLNTVFGFGPNDVWIGGNLESGPQASIQQWTGAGWVDRSDAVIDSFESIMHLGGTSSNDLWAVSSYSPPIPGSMAHWNGSAWTIVSPSVGPDLFDGGILQLGSGANNLWAFGEHFSQTANIIQSAQPPLTSWTNRNFTKWDYVTVFGMFGEITPFPAADIKINWRKDMNVPSIPGNFYSQMRGISYDPVKQKAYMWISGGNSLEFYTTDGYGWLYETSQGSRPPYANADPTRSFVSGGHCMVYDSVRNVHVLYGGRSQATIDDDDGRIFELDTSTNPPTWTRKGGFGFGGTHPGRQWHFCMAFDGSVTVIVCPTGYGSGTGGGVYTWDGTSWSFVNSSPSFESASMAYDESAGNIVLFGTDGTTWTGNGAGFTQQSPSTSPPARQYADMAYHSGVGGVIMFGGCEQITGDKFPLADCWRWDGGVGEWYRVWHRTELDPNVAICGHRMVWIPVSSKIISYGGEVDRGY